MATAPSDNGEYTHFEATEAPSECSRNLQAAENETAAGAPAGGGGLIQPLAQRHRDFLDAARKDRVKVTRPQAAAKRENKGLGIALVRDGRGESRHVPGVGIRR